MVRRVGGRLAHLELDPDHNVRASAQPHARAAIGVGESAQAVDDKGAEIIFPAPVGPDVSRNTAKDKRLKEKKRRKEKKKKERKV